MKIETQPTADIPFITLYRILDELPLVTKHPEDKIKYSFQTILDGVKPFGSQVDHEYDTTEIVFKKIDTPYLSWAFESATRVRTTIYIGDYIPAN